MGILLHSISKSVNHLMAVRAQNNILLVHMRQDPCIKNSISRSVFMIRMQTVLYSQAFKKLPYNMHCQHFLYIISKISTDSRKN